MAKCFSSTNFDKFMAMFPLSTVLFTLSCLTPSVVNSFARFSSHSTVSFATRFAFEKLSLELAVQPSASVDQEEIGSMNCVIVGTAALEKLIRSANYVISPMSEKNEFFQWAQQTTKRKLYSDKEFKERVKVRELKKLHSETIKR